jgi:hypothetical protein
MFRASTRKDFEAMARTADFVDDNNIPLLGIDIDPMIGTPEYETGIPIVEVPSPDEITEPILKTGWHCNVRVSGERELEEIDGLEQYDEDGNFLPVSQRTHFGITFADGGTVVADGTTEGVQYANVALIDETTIVTPQRVWQ